MPQSDDATCLPTACRDDRGAHGIRGIARGTHDHRKALRAIDEEGTRDTRGRDLGDTIEQGVEVIITGGKVMLRPALQLQMR